MVQRVLEMGSPGAGKSRLARAIGAKLNPRLVHLDVLNFHPDWVETETELFHARINDAISGDRWMTDGNYVGKSADLRLSRADAIIWIPMSENSMAS